MSSMPGLNPGLWVRCQV